MRLSLGKGVPEDVDVGAAAWVARCVGRAEAIPLGKVDRDALAACLRRQELKVGEPLFRAGEPMPGVWIVQSGLVELLAGSTGERVVVQLLRPGDVEGDTFIVVDQAPRYSARAAADSTLLFLSRESFEKLLEERPRIAQRWLSSLATRLGRAQARMLELLSLLVPEKVARVILDEAVDGEILLPQRTLAAMLAIRRPTLNRELKSFQRKGLVDVGYSKITILDQRGLEEIAHVSQR